MTESIQAAWDSFREACVPADAPPHQVNYIKATFYAGAHSTLNLIQQFTQIENEKLAQWKVNGLYKEVADHNKELINQKPQEDN